MRSPYGGFITSVPDSAGGNRCSASAVLNSIASRTPARSALRCAKSVIRKLTSPAWTATLGAWTRARAASPSCCQSRCSARNGISRSNAKRLCKPGAMPQLICAASIAIVPAPQHGSSKGASSARPSHPAAASIAAASVSFSGASPVSSRQPRLNSASPEVSTYSVAWSALRCSSSDRSGRQVSTLGRSPASSRITSHTASLMRRPAKFRLFSGERCAVTSTRSVSRGLIQSVQRMLQPSS